MSAPAGPQRFERLYRQSPDPWGYRTSRYEREKYAETLAALPAGELELCLEVGCSIGVFTALLAERCRHVVAIDFSLRAIELAREELRGVENVELLRAAFPGEAPPGSWDVVVCSEVLYYLREPELEQAIGWIEAQLAHGTCVVAVSWRGPGRDEPFSGDQVHDRLARQLSGSHTLDVRRQGYRLDRFEAR